MKKKYILAFVALCFTTLSFAGIKVEAPSVVALGERFSVTFNLDEKPSSFEWEPSADFQLVWGPQTGSSTSISIVNGKTTKVSQHTYTYILLPRNKGKFNLPAAHAVISKEDVYSRAASIEVVGDGASSSSSQASGGNSAGASSDAASEPAAAGQKTPTEDTFLRLSVSRNSAVVGEPINVTLKLYTRSNIAGFEDARFPSFDGFWSQETESPQNISFIRENVGDRIYNSAVLRRWVIIPQKAGKTKIDAAELVCLVQQRVSSGNSIFDGFFDDVQTSRIRATSSPYVINVSALPAGAPASFTGAVGEFSISAALDKDSLKVHDAASLCVKVSGSGNIALVGAPKVAFPPDSEIYDTKTSDQKGSTPTSGTKIFEFPFIPRSHGDFTIPPIEFSYFDIKARKYVTLSTPAIPYNVAAGKGENYVAPGGVDIPQISNKKDVKNLSSDIHFISTRIPALSSETHFFVGSAAFIILVVLLLLMALVIYFVVKTMRVRSNDVVSVRTRGAHKAARKRLALANGYLEKNLYSAFYEELHKALLGYAADKLNIGAAELNKEQISSDFLAAGASQELVASLVELIDKCEYARYAPDGGATAMREDYDKAVNTISGLQDNMKQNSSKFFSIALALLLSCSLFAQAEPVSYIDSLWNAGVQAYTDQDYVSARKSFLSIADASLSSPELYTNIADSYYKNGEIAPAVLWYNRALRLDPSYKDARFNLELARAKCQDRIETVPEFFLVTWNRNLCYLFSSNVWAVTALILFALMLGMVLLFLLARRRGVRMSGFFIALVCLIVSVICFANAAWQKKDFNMRSSAVVMSPVCSIKSTPSSSGGSDLFVLHEGTCVTLLDTVGDWCKISITDGREGWIRVSDIEVI